MRSTARETESSARCVRTRTPSCSRDQGDVQTGRDPLLAEGFEQERLAGAGGAGDDKVLPAVHPLQGA